jgi:hypothetical protein
MRLSKAIGFGSIKPTAGTLKTKQEEKPRYALVFTWQMRNRLNHSNPGPIIGNIASPFFGKANQAAGQQQSGTNFSESATNRRFELQMRYSF